LRVLLLGADGFIGSAVRGRLVAQGHDVVGVSRRRHLAHAERVRWLEADLARLSCAEWRPHLSGIDAVVNCAGLFQDIGRDTTSGVHVHGSAMLYEACEAEGVRRVVHISAVGADREALTPFSATKQAGEALLMARDLDWIVLRPSVVTGRAAYGGSALLRAVAALPFLPELPDAGRLQIVQLDDLVAAVLFFLAPSSPARLALDVVGPDKLAFTDVLLLYRRWLGLRPGRRLRIPRWAAALGYRLGDLVALLGWRSPLRSTARMELARGAIGDAGPWIEATGIEPTSLAAALDAEPASVQERWFARLYFLKPVLFGALAVFWIATGVISLGPGWEGGIDYLRRAGAGGLAPGGVIAGALIDVLIGLGIAFRRTTKAALAAAALVSIAYLVAGSFLLPALWSDPLGPLLKILPILALILGARAIAEDR
jgi:uncharacterized protein YbjT (DUF2867 family)